MTSLPLIRTDDRNFRHQWDNLRAKLTLEAAIFDNTQRIEQVRKIVEDVRRRRDDAVAELTAAYDNVSLKPQEFRVPENITQQAHKNIPPVLLAALRQAIKNVRTYQQEILFQQRQIRRWSGPAGVRFGELYRPLKRVGVCVPAASAPLVSTVIMTVVPAQVAGVREIAVISAPKVDCNNNIHPTILGLCYELNVKEVYRISGAQAVAALAFGTKTIPKVDKIVGPGNWWVQLAKKEVYGLVDIDSFAGPSEVLIIADNSARAEWVAADMLSQAEHAPGSAILVTDSQKLAQETAEQLDKQLKKLNRAKETEKCVQQFCLAVVTQDLAEAVELANEFAPEHLQIQCTDSEMIAEKILDKGANAGAIFVGPYTPVAVGDYYAGPSHTLPTGGSARFFSPLSANDFLKQSSVVSYGEKALKNAARDIEAIAHAEGLDAHARSVTLRTNR